MRWGHHCPSEAVALGMIAFFERLAELSGDYSGFRVIKLVAFRRSAKSSGEASSSGSGTELLRKRRKRSGEEAVD